MSAEVLDQSIKFVYLDTSGALRDFDPETGEGPILEVVCNDRELCEASESCEDSADQGVVRGYLGVDKHWHFDGRLTKTERLSLGLYSGQAERVEYMKGARL